MWKTFLIFATTHHQFDNTMAKKTAKKDKAKTKKTAKKTTPKKSLSKKKSSAKSKKGKVKNLNRYNQVQKILSSYCKEKGLTLGKDFNRVASVINQNTKDKPLKYVKDNIDAIYLEYFGKPVDVNIPDTSPFYYFNETILTEAFNSYQITIKFDDGEEKFDFSGDSLQVIEYFKSSGMYNRCRKYYNDSPVATFVLKGVVGNNVEYFCETFYKPTEPSPESSPEAKPSDIGTEKPSVAVPYSASEVIAIEKEKQKTEKAKQKTLNEVQKLLKQGFTKDEIFRLLGK